LKLNVLNCRGVEGGPFRKGITLLDQKTFRHGETAPS
jgi:hypothetical protein